MEQHIAFITILNLVNERCPNIRTPKYSNAYYLNNIILVLRDVVSWKSLSRVYKHSSKFHYKTIYDIYLKWCKLNIFEDVFNILSNTFYLSQYTTSSNINLYIDSSSINNKYGRELVAYGGENKKKQITKISLICNEDKFPVSVTFYSGNIVDVTTIYKSLNPLLDKIYYKQINLMGDKGYISKNIENDLQKKSINLIAIKRKNQAVQNTKSELDLLKNRYKIENVNQIMKDFNRISIRRDKKLITFKSFVFLGFLIKYFK